MGGRATGHMRQKSPNKQGAFAVAKEALGAPIGKARSQQAVSQAEAPRCGRWRCAPPPIERLSGACLADEDALMACAEKRWCRADKPRRRCALQRPPTKRFAGAASS